MTGVIKTKPLLISQLGLMAGLIVAALVWPQAFLTFIKRPELFIHAKFLHVLTVTLFFANAVIGTIWETRSLMTNSPEIIRHTYKTVIWLDAVFTAPLILVAVLTGIMLGTIMGGVWSMKWLALAFSLFLFSGALWVALDIPTQYKTKRLFELVPADAKALPAELTKLLWIRLGINLFTILPLLVIFYLMVHKPELAWLRH